MNRVLNRTKMLAAWIRKGVATTKVRYILSYLVVYLMLIIGFQFIMEQYFAELYLKQILRQTENQLEIWNEGIDSNLVYLMQMNNALEMNIDVLMARYELESQNDYQTGMELQKYDQASKLVTSIVYKTSDKLLSTMLPVTCEDNVFCFHDRGEIYFDLKPYLDSERAQLIYIGTEQAGELIYLPATDSRKNYVLMYVLDKEELLGSLEKTGLFPSTETVFLDNRKNIIMATGDGEQHLDLAEFALEEGTFSVRDFKYVCVEISQGDLYAVVVITEDALMQEVRTLFVGAYCMLVLLGLAGVLVICFSMKFTYGSLEVFAQKFLQDQDSKEDYFKQLDQVFTTKMEESIQMGEKLEKYRTGVQKSLLDSLMADSDRVDLDRLFEVDEVQIFLLGVQVSEAMDSSEIEAQLQLLLPAGYEIFMLKAEEQELLYLLNCKQDIFEEEIEEKAKRMEHMLEKMNEAYGNVFFLSSGSDSPLDILEMYREIKTKMIIEKAELDRASRCRQSGTVNIRMRSWMNYRTVFTNMILRQSAACLNRFCRKSVKCIWNRKN